MLAAMRSSDSSYDGLFYTGVKSTSIFCLPSCKAKKPLPKNVVFFKLRSDAVILGFRPCKRCRPDLYPHYRPSWINDCLRIFDKNLNKRITDADLAEQIQMNARTMRRLFQQQFDKTPAQYHRELRLERAARLLEANHPILEVSEECGYHSLSGFVEAFHKRFGKSLGKYEG